MKKILGCLMLAGFFIFLFYAHSSSYGLEQALIGWSLAVVIILFIVAAVYLITHEDK